MGASLQPSRANCLEHHLGTWALGQPLISFLPASINSGALAKCGCLYQQITRYSAGCSRCATADSSQYTVGILSVTLLTRTPPDLSIWPLQRPCYCRIANALVGGAIRAIRAIRFHCSNVRQPRHQMCLTSFAHESKPRNSGLRLACIASTTGNGHLVLIWQHPITGRMRNLFVTQVAGIVNLSPHLA